MVITAIIKPITQQGHTMNLPGSYQIDGKIRILTQANEVLVVNSEKEVNEMYANVIKQHSFTSQMPEFRYQWESDEGKRTNLHQRNFRTVMTFLKEHPCCAFNGTVKPGSVPMFDIEVDTVKISASHATFKEKLAIQNALNDMPFERLRDISEYYGESPQGVTEPELLPRLSQKICNDDTLMKSFMAVWMKEPSEDTHISVIARRAIRLSVIQTQNIEGRDHYYNGTSPIGNCLEDVIAFCKREPKIFTEYIERETRKADTGADNISELSKENTSHIVNKANKSAEEASEYASLSVRWKELLTDGYVQRKPNAWALRKQLGVLREIVENGEAKKDKDNAVAG